MLRVRTPASMPSRMLGSGMHCMAGILGVITGIFNNDDNHGNGSHTLHQMFSHVFSHPHKNLHFTNEERCLSQIARKGQIWGLNTHFSDAQISKTLLCFPVPNWELEPTAPKDKDL